MALDKSLPDDTFWKSQHDDDEVRTKKTPDQVPFSLAIEEASNGPVSLSTVHCLGECLLSQQTEGVQSRFQEQVLGAVQLH